MLRFDIITIFPEIFDSYFKESIIRRAQKKRLIKIKIHNLRDFAQDARRSVDDRPYGGGPGMILRVDVMFRAVKKIIQKSRRIQNRQRKIILLSAKGKKFDQKMALKLSKLKQVVLICGRYEGVDERVAKYVADEEISIGDYVLTGGELPAMVITDAVARLIPGVIKKDSLKEESFSFKIQNSKFKIQREYPQYTRPEVFDPGKNKRKWRVPKILLSGHHKKIEEWRRKHTKLEREVYL